MSINGQTIQNAALTVYADLEGPNHVIGANLIVYQLNQPGGTRNQNWRFIPVNAGRNLYTIVSVLTGGYASVDSPAAGQIVKHSLTSTPWEVTVVNNSSPYFIIKLPNTNYVWTITRETKSTIKIQNANNDQLQQWKIADV